MSIRFKIISLTMLIFSIGVVLGVTGYVSSVKLTAMADEQHVLSEKSGSVTTVLNAHYTWKQTLTEAALFMQPFTGSLDPDTCALGQWHNSDAAKGIDDDQLLSLLAKLDSPHDYIHREAATVVALIAEGNSAEAQRILKENILPRASEAITLLSSMEARYAELIQQSGAAIVEFGNTMKLVIVLAIAAAFFVSLFMTWLVTHSIMTPMRNMAKAGELIAVGDLDVEVRHDVDDELGALSHAFNSIIDATRKQVALTAALAQGDLTATIEARSDKDRMNTELGVMLDRLNEMFSGITASSEQVAAGAKEMSDGAQNLALGSTEQSAAVEQLSASIAEIAGKTADNAGRAERAAELAEVIKHNAEKGSGQMDEMMTAVREINEASQNISRVIKAIDEIAFQTNILALNAAVEAARAGQHGKGFAVVAEEVRNLAAKSAEAAKDTEALIANSMEKAEFGSRIAADTAASLSEIVSGINESSALINDIARLSGEQSEGIEQINKGIGQVAQVVQQNSATAQQSAAASEEMSGQSEMLGEMISRFKIRRSRSDNNRMMPLPAVSREPAPRRSGGGGIGKY